MKKIVFCLLISLYFSVSFAFSQTNSISNELINDAKSGNSRSQALLAGLYLESSVTYKDGFEFAKQSADQGDAIGIYLLGQCYEKGLGTVADYSKGELFYQKAVDLLKS